jgi:hypothetical protein
MPDPRTETLERAAARHWQAPDTEPLGEWLLRAADGFTGRANSALPLGDPGRPLPEAVTAVAQWYRRRGLRSMIVLPQGAAPDHLETHLNERGWLPRPAPAFVMVAEIAGLPASQTDSASPARLRAPAAPVFPPRSSQAPRSSVQTGARPLARGGSDAASLNPVPTPVRLTTLPDDPIRITSFLQLILHASPAVDADLASGRDGQ